MQASEIVLDKSLFASITVDQAWHYRILPVSKDGSSITFYIDEETNIASAGQELEMLLNQPIHFLPESSEWMQKMLSTHYRRQSERQKREQTFSGDSDSFLPKLIGEAKELGSSDIHIEIYEDKCRVRIRIDGQLVERYKIEKADYPAIINKIKIMSKLDIAEKRLPQDGRIFFQNSNNKFDIRVSILPTLHGEKVVLRLLSNDATNIDIRKLGFSEFDLENYLEGIRRPEGILLISGPTGSGKTTSLYATLKLLNTEARNIVTIEDPIEYTLEGINQVQVKDNIGFTFASALRTFLRQDPNVIMLGEIRDGETASMAIRAALTGHLVLSTIHTNSAWGTISRLVDMGVPPFLVANTLNTSVAQRLVRLLCPECKKEEAFDSKLYPRQFVPYRKVSHHFVAGGCENCHYTGYKGRKAVYEVIPIDEELAIKIKNSSFDVAEDLKKRGVRSLTENAFELFEHGTTSIEEIYPLLFNF